MLKLNVVFIAAGAAVLSTPACAAATPAPTPSICLALSKAIDSQEQEISSLTAEEMAEDSAPRAAVEMGKVNAGYLAIQANIMLMIQHHCSPYAHTIEGGAFLMPALSCNTDTMKSILAGPREGAPSQPGSCDRSKWTRDN